MNEENPEVVQIPVSKLKEWLMHVSDGIDPTVKFDSYDNNAMLLDAYHARGKELNYLSVQLRVYMGD